MGSQRIQHSWATFTHSLTPSSSKCLRLWFTSQMVISIPLTFYLEGELGGRYTALLPHLFFRLSAASLLQLPNVFFCPLTCGSGGYWWQSLQKVLSLCCSWVRRLYGLPLAALITHSLSVWWTFVLPLPSPVISLKDLLVSSFLFILSQHPLSYSLDHPWSHFFTCGSSEIQSMFPTSPCSPPLENCSEHTSPKLHSHCSPYIKLLLIFGSKQWCPLLPPACPDSPSLLPNLGPAQVSTFLLHLLCVPFLLSCPCSAPDPHSVSQTLKIPFWQVTWLSCWGGIQVHLKQNLHRLLIALLVFSH